MIDVFSKYTEMIETTIDLDRIRNHEYVIKPDYDEDLKSKSFIRSFFHLFRSFLLLQNVEKNKMIWNRKCTKIFLPCAINSLRSYRQRPVVHLYRRNRTDTSRIKIRFDSATIQSKEDGCIESIAKKVRHYKNN